MAGVCVAALAVVVVVVCNGYRIAVYVYIYFAYYIHIATYKLVCQPALNGKVKGCKHVPKLGETRRYIPKMRAEACCRVVFVAGVYVLRVSGLVV